MVKPSSTDDTVCVFVYRQNHPVSSLHSFSIPPPFFPPPIPLPVPRSRSWIHDVLLYPMTDSLPPSLRRTEARKLRNHEKKSLLEEKRANGAPCILYSTVQTLCKSNSVQPVADLKVKDGKVCMYYKYSPCAALSLCTHCRIPCMCVLVCASRENWELCGFPFSM